MDQENTVRDMAYRHMKRILAKEKLTSKQLRKLEQLSKIVFDVNLYEFNLMRNRLQSLSGGVALRAGSLARKAKGSSIDSCAESK